MQKPNASRPLRRQIGEREGKQEIKVTHMPKHHAIKTYGGVELKCSSSLSGIKSLYSEK